MAILRISEYSAGSLAGIQAVQCPALVVQPRIDFTDGAVHNSAAFSGDTRIVRFCVDAICVVRVGGKNPVVSQDDDRFVSGQWEYRWVNPGDALSVQTTT